MEERIGRTSMMNVTAWKVREKLGHAPASTASQEEPGLGRQFVRTNGRPMTLVWVVRNTASMPYPSATL